MDTAVRTLSKNRITRPARGSAWALGRTLVRKRLASMRSGATLINTGRGALVDEEALIEALSSGRLRAGLDVFESEPLPADHPLFSLDNAVLLPHVGSATFSTRIAMVIRALENLRAGMSGQPLPFCANPEVCGFNG